MSAPPTEPTHKLNVNGTIRVAVVDAEGNDQGVIRWLDADEMDTPPRETVQWEPRRYSRSGY